MARLQTRNKFETTAGIAQGGKNLYTAPSGCTVRTKQPLDWSMGNDGDPNPHKALTGSWYGRLSGLFVREHKASTC